MERLLANDLCNAAFANQIDELSAMLSCPIYRQNINGEGEHGKLAHVIS